MKAIEQCVSVVLFITLYKVVLTFESVDEILGPVATRMARRVAVMYMQVAMRWLRGQL